MSNKAVQNKSHNSDKMTADKMADTLCKFQNSGYCKYLERCRFKHVTEKCETKCDRKTCRKRHQKTCKFGLKCRRLETCEYKHQTISEENGLKAKISSLEATVSKLLEENKATQEKMVKMEIDFKANLKNITKESKEKDKVITKLKEKLKENEDENKDITKENKEKDKVITKLKEKLKEKEDENKDQNVELIKREKENQLKNKEIKSLKQTLTKNNMETKGKGECCTKRVDDFINTLIPCEFCESLWQNDDDLKTHETLCRDHYGS